MDVEELMEMLSNCYSDAKVVVDLEDASNDNGAAEIEAVEFDDFANVAHIVLKR